MNPLPPLSGAGDARPYGIYETRNAMADSTPSSEETKTPAKVSAMKVGRGQRGGGGEREEAREREWGKNTGE